jgi:hypothetical protein
MILLKKHLVVAYYYEDLDWLKEIDSFDKVFIYNKNIKDVPNSIRLPNVGREAHTFLHHIVNMYNDLPDITVFVQGNPFQHITKLKENSAKELNSFFKNHNYSNDRAEPLLTELMVDFAPYTARCFRDCLDGIIPNPITFSPGAQWIVPKECIHSKSLGFYKRLLNELKIDKVSNNDGVYNAWNMEGMWQYIFSKDCVEIL